MSTFTLRKKIDMKKINCIFQICLICIAALGLMSCNGDSDLEQSDGDTEQADGDSKQADGDTDSDCVEDAEEVELTPCAMADSGALTQDTDELEEWKERCFALRGPEYDIREYDDSIPHACVPITLGFADRKSVV